MSPVHFTDAEPTGADSTARDVVRTLLQDGVLSSGQAFNIARLEDISDQIPTGDAPFTQTVFTVRFSSVPVEEYVTVFAAPGSLLAYIDGAPGVAPSSDVDQNGTFDLPAAPQLSLEITYGWGYFSDEDIDTFIDQARSWLLQADLDSTPDGLRPALTLYAASNAAEALARKCTLADATAGDADLKLSQIATSYINLGKKWMAEAVAALANFNNAAGAKTTAAGAIGSLCGPGVGNWQPPR